MAGRRAALALAAMLALLPLAAMAETNSWMCRQAPGSAHAGCGLPYNLSNFQSHQPCDTTVLVGRPNSVQDIQDIVSAYDRVKGVGVGHSWNGDQFCPPASSSGENVNIVTTEVAGTLGYIQKPLTAAQWRAQGSPSDFPILVDEAAETVTVAAGIPQRLLLDFLAGYTIGSRPQGWTLGAFSWFIDQTIGGAVATGTHGSSLEYGSLSSQVVSMRVALANGTLYDASRESDPHLWRALGISVGRLGVITELTMKIVPQQTVTKTVTEKTWDDFVSELRSIQDDYVAAKASGDQQAIKRALAPLDERQLFWFPVSRDVSQVDYTYSDKDPENVIENLAGSQTPSPGGDDDASGGDGGDANANAVAVASEDSAAAAAATSSIVFEQVFANPVPPNIALVTGPDLWDAFYHTAIAVYLMPGTYASRNAFLAQTEFTTATIDYAPYDQYEVSVALEKAGDCLAGLTNHVYGPERWVDGFRTPPLIRFISGEDFYLSPSSGGPRVYLNIEDFVTLSKGSVNEPFSNVIAYFVNECDARMHWGKAGWPAHLPCFDGASKFPETWCDFGCAVNDLDPKGKFDPRVDLWQWHAARNGTEVEFASCCSADGFSPECTCASRTDCSK